MTFFPKIFTSKIAGITHVDWDLSFWFAVLSPVLGIVIGFLALLLFYH